jgi:Fe-S-cluster containining protein
MEDDAARTSAIERLRALDKKTRGLTPQGRAKLHEPCAILKDRSCMVYAVRPLVCAEFTSFDVKDCIKGYHAGFMNVSVVGDRRNKHVYEAVRQGLEQGLSEALPEPDTADLELTAAVVDALDSPDAAAEWLAGGPVFEGAHLVSDPEERDDLAYSSQTKA